MHADDRRQALFGSFDGLSTVLGVILLLATASSVLITRAALGAALAGTVSMAAGEWLSDPDRQVHRALVMGSATGVGTFVPVIGFYVGGKLLGWVVVGVVSLAIGAWISYERKRPWETFGVLILVTGLCYGASLLL